MIFGGDEYEAMARLRAVAEERPSDVTLAGALGELYRIRGRLPEAVRWRRKAALLDPLQADRWQGLFQLYWWLQMYDESGEALQRAHDLDPRNPRIWQQYAWNWMAQGRFNEALAAADSARLLGPEIAPFERALVLWWSGDAEAAVEAHSASLSDFSAEPPEWQQIPMAHAHFAVGDSAQGRQIVEDLRAVLESRVIEDYEPEWRVFPRLQLAAMDRDVTRAIDLFRLYVERGGRDPTWFQQSPLFSHLREQPAFMQELNELDQLVTEMRRQVVRELGSRS
jgi:tetratricopeptide (TPR) repeat protein